MKEMYCKWHKSFFLNRNFLDRELKIKGLARRISRSKVEGMALRRKKKKIVREKLLLDKDGMIFNRNE